MVSTKREGMRSKRLGGDSAAPAIVHPHLVIRERPLAELLNMTPSSLARERKLGRIRHAVRLNAIWYEGQWILDWLRGGEVKPAAAEVLGS